MPHQLDLHPENEVVQPHESGGPPFNAGMHFREIRFPVIIDTQKGAKIAVNLPGFPPQVVHEDEMDIPPVHQRKQPLNLRTEHADFAILQHHGDATMSGQRLSFGSSILQLPGGAHIGNVLDQTAEHFAMPGKHHVHRVSQHDNEFGLGIVIQNCGNRFRVVEVLRRAGPDQLMNVLIKMWEESGVIFPDSLDFQPGGAQRGAKKMGLLGA